MEIGQRSVCVFVRPCTDVCYGLTCAFVRSVSPWRKWKRKQSRPNQNQVTPLSGPRLTFTAFLWLRARSLQREAPLHRITDLLASVNLHIKQRLTSRGSYLKKKDIEQQETVRIYHSRFLTRIFREEKEGNLAGGAVCVLSHNISAFLFSLLNSLSLRMCVRAFYR